MFRTLRLLKPSNFCKDNNSFTKSVNKYYTKNILNFKWLYDYDMIDDTLSCRLPEPSFTGMGYKIQLYKVIRTFKLVPFELWTTGYSVKIPIGYYGVILPNNKDIQTYGIYNTIKSHNEEEILIFVNSNINNIYKNYTLLVLPTNDI